jgi:hypothetical protein
MQFQGRQRVSLRARSNQHFVYSGLSLLVVNLDGVITRSGSEGFYFENTRLLALDELRANGKPLSCIVASPVEGNSFLAYMAAAESDGIPAQSIYLEIARFLGEGLRTEIRLQNYSVRETARFELTLCLAADFADMEEAIQGKRQQQAPVDATWDDVRREVLFRYRHPDLNRSVAIRVEQSPAPVRWADDSLHFEVELQPHRPAEIHLSVEPIFDGARHRAPQGTFGAVASPLRRVQQQLQDEAPTLTTTNPTVARAWRTAVRDLASLPLGLEPGPATPIAGLPLYQQFFGRDTLTIAWQALLAMPRMMRDTLLANAAHQGRVVDDWSSTIGETKSPAR